MWAKERASSRTGGEPLTVCIPRTPSRNSSETAPITIAIHSVPLTRKAATTPRPRSRSTSKVSVIGRLQRALGGAVVAGRPDRDQDERERAGHLAPRGRAGERPAQAQPPVADLERRERREHAEVDRERLPLLDPALDPEQGHRHEGDRRVDEGRDRDDLGPQADAEAAGPVDQLEPDEGEDAGHGRPVPEALGIVERRAAATAARPAGSTPEKVRAIARHGLKARKTSPKSTLSTTSPSQKVTKTKVSEKFRSGASIPSSPE